MQIIPKEQMIGCQTWYDLADYHYNGRDDLPSGVIHCDMQAIPELFEKLKRQGDNKYIVISSRSDFGVFYQQRHPPFRDYAKVANMFIGPQNSQMGYVPFTIPQPVNLERCDSTHKYSIKCYMFTEATFDEIPKQVHRWLVANNGILDDPRVIGIPFGINNVDFDENALNKISALTQNMNWDGDRARDLYVNFTFYTSERAKLYQLYQRFNWATAEQGQSVDHYFGQLVVHNMALCPPGNGMDCYRVLEALYLGCIPVMELNELAQTYINLKLPVLLLESLESITEPVLSYVRHSDLYDRNNWNLTGITVSFWRNYIDRLKDELWMQVPDDLAKEILGTEANG